MCVCVHTYVHTHFYTHTCIHTYIYVCIYTHIHTYTYTYMYVYIYTYMYVYIHTYIYIYIYIYILCMHIIIINIFHKYHESRVSYVKRIEEIFVSHVTRRHLLSTNDTISPTTSHGTHTSAECHTDESVVSHMLTSFPPFDGWTEYAPSRVTARTQMRHITRMLASLHMS